MDLAQIVTLILSIIAIIISVWNVTRTNTLTKANHQSIIFSDYTRRYQSLIQAMPNKLFPCGDVLGPDVAKYMSLYFDLCSEEFWLYSNDYIPNEIWKNWVEGMKLTTRNQIYHTAWKVLSQTYHEKFVNFMDNEVLFPNR